MNEKPFEIRVAGFDVALTLGKCACVLFRTTPGIDYLKVDISEDTGIEDNTLTIFNNVELVRYMAGIALDSSGRPLQTANDGESFAETYGWNPAVVIKWQPSDKEREDWLEVTAENLEDEWELFNED